MIKDFWEDCHENNSIRYLTGSTGKEIWQELKIEKMIYPSAKVLNIGVGTGQCTNDLKSVGVDVSALDISEKALFKVADICEEVFLPYTDLPYHYFDLAISHLVAQHMNDIDLIAQIKNVLPSLKRFGIFAIQFAFPLTVSSKENNIDEEIQMQAGSISRTKEQIIKIVKKAKGRINFMEVSREFPEYGSGWLTVHVMRNN
jgi:ubiquinone/menaquinone biosynthesis C-methylase UbiE